jgi:tetratricopeptide (TPR) repeat protein
MTRWNRSIRLALFVIGSLATSVAAQPAPPPNKQPTQQELASARAHFKAAEAAKARRDYKTAAIEYLAAHELFPDPEFFFDVGEVYRLAGDEPDALTYYQKYLELEPSGRGAATARTAIDELRRSIAAQQAAAKRAADDEAKRKAAEDARRKADEDAAKRATDDEAKRKAAEDARRKADEDAAMRASGGEAKRKQPATSPEMPPPAAAARAWYRDPVTLALLGTGAAAIGVGTGFLWSAHSADQEARTAKTYQQVLDARSRAVQHSTRGLIAGGVGIALVGGGMVWTVLHRESSEQRTVTGWLMPGSGGLAVTGRF